MCGRFFVDEETAREIEKVIHNVDLQIQRMRTGDIFPSQPAGILIQCGKRREQTAEIASGSISPALELKEMQWGFPQYQKKGLLINARAETALERKTFRDSVLHRRCVIPAKHFYEWDSDKNKVTFFRKDAAVVYMAGFYNRFGDEERFIILTTQANASVSPVHHRMPLVLETGELKEWVYDDQFAQYALHKTPPVLGREQEYEQQSLFMT